MVVVDDVVVVVECLVECLFEYDFGVFDGVVVVGLQVARGFDVEVEVVVVG